MVVSTFSAMPFIGENPVLQEYYHSIESRLGYWLLLGSTRHFGYYDHDSYWPFPINGALRAMEDRLAELLNLPAGSTVLDMGCGMGLVPIHLAEKWGLRVQAFDIVDIHVQEAKRRFERARVPKGMLQASQMDFHHLETLDDTSFDGLYSMETFVHATDPVGALAGFYRVLKPGGKLVIFHYDNQYFDDAASPQQTSGLSTGTSVASRKDGFVPITDGMRKVNDWSAMPTNAMSHPGVLEGWLEDAGFVDITVHDYSENVKPMARLFYVLAYIPYLLITLLGLQRKFVNTVAAVAIWESTKARHVRYIAVSASKPGPPIESPKLK